MKQDIHPQYIEKTMVKCSCGNTFTVGSTRKQIDVEICSKCHPFYTGDQKLIDVAGRVEKFRARKQKAVEAPVKKKKTRTRKAPTPAGVGVPTKTSGKQDTKAVAKKK